MTFGMPRALFAVLAVSVYGAGAEGTGLLYAAVAAGATVAALTTGWLAHARRLGRIVIWAVAVWGGAIALAGLAGSLWAAAALLAVAGAADSVSAVCRSAINQDVTPDRLRGRMSSVFMLVVASGPRLGDVEAGTVAAVGGVRFSVVSGGLACLAGRRARGVPVPGARPLRRGRGARGGRGGRRRLSAVRRLAPGGYTSSDGGGRAQAPEGPRRRRAPEVPRAGLGGRVTTSATT